LGFETLLANLFTWWAGSGTIGTIWTTWTRGRPVGTDEFGNRYYEDRTAKQSYDKGRKRRWVKYKGYADASKIPPDWHGWMHYIYDTPPSQQPLPKKAWEKPHVPNMSGTPFAVYPKGSLNNPEVQRQPSSGDYEAWNP
jgi:NADH:ubiquinone oxidoreductase subunit